MLPWYSWIVVLGVWRVANGKWVEGRVDTKENWAFLSRFCFLSLEGQFEYQLEFDKDMGIPNLLLYYDDESQWPAVYHSSKSCKEREAVLNKNGQNQVIKLSHWYPETEVSGCVIKMEDKELPSGKSPTTTPAPTTKATTSKTAQIPKNNTNTTTLPPEPSYYDQFLKTTTPKTKTTITDANATTWYEVLPTDELNSTTTGEELWESVGGGNGSHAENLKDVEMMFSSNEIHGHKIKRSTFELYERYRRRRLNAETEQNGGDYQHRRTERMVVSCHNSRRFRSARERWWFIAISNCDNPKGLDVRYRFLMTNGPDGDFWHEHFSADEFYVLPVLLAYTFAYVLVMVAVVLCSVELKSRHLLHSTYKLFLFSITVQHFGVTLQSLAYLKYAVNGFGGEHARVAGQFLTGLAEMTFLLLLVLMAKGYTITRGRLKLGFTVKLTVFMCLYCAGYIVLFIYQAKAFDPGEVLYLYESPPGYGLITLRLLAWGMFAYATFFTVRKFPEKNTFYCPFFICATLWFFAGPLFIITANSYIDKWVRESVVTAVLLFITFSGHIMFLLLTLPVFANKNFPYHVRTTQIGIMEVRRTGDIDNFGHSAYHPSNGSAQTVIIPLTRRTEELIGNMYNQYMAAPADSEIRGKPNGMARSDSMSPKNLLNHQSSSETNTSEDIKPTVSSDRGNVTRDVFTVQTEMDKYNSKHSPKEAERMPKTSELFPNSSELLPKSSEQLPKSNEVPNDGANGGMSGALPILSPLDPESRKLPLLRSRRNLLDPIKLEAVPSWSLAKGPSVVAMMAKAKDETKEEIPTASLISNGVKKAPIVRNGLPSSGEISTIVEGHVQNYANTVSRATIDLFSAGKKL